jgi:hypothetical protein
LPAAHSCPNALLASQGWEFPASFSHPDERPPHFGRAFLAIRLARLMLLGTAGGDRMNPIPTVPMVGGTGAPLEGLPMQLLGLFLMIVVVTIYAMIVRAATHVGERRVRLHCPSQLRDATVTVVTTEKGMTDVVACSLLRGKAITCGKPCIQMAATA